MTPLLILYASQTGNAEDVAERIFREAKRWHFRPRLASMDWVKAEDIFRAPFAVFVCSTTGQGDMPETMKSLWTFLLRKKLDSTVLCGLSFAVFGLGDSSYPRYNFPSKKLYKRLQQLGATPIIERGDGDDQHPLGFDGALYPWLTKLWDRLSELNPLGPLVPDSVTNAVPSPTFVLTYLEGDVQSDDLIDDVDQLDTFREPAKALTMRPKVPSKLLRNDRLTSIDHFQDVRHVILDLNHSEVTYGPGDIVNFRPQNLSDDVEEFIGRFNWQDIADKPCRLTWNDPTIGKSDQHSRILTLRWLLQHYLDIFGKPRRYFFELLSYFASDPDQKEKLMYFSSPEGQNDLYQYCYRVHRNAAEVLRDFNSVVFPPEYLLDLFSAMRPRQFSIASSQLVHPHELHVLAAIVRYRTKLSTPRHGVFTKFLSTLKPGDTIDLWTSKGTFTQPPDELAPVILIGPGTGIAPMRSILEDRVARGISNNIVVQGIRSVDKDFFFVEQFQEYASKHFLKHFLAASRDQSAKVYVQDLISDEAETIWRALLRGGTIYLSGKSGLMPQGVRDALEKCFMTVGGLSSDAAKDFLSTLERTKRFQEETWSS
ncbi:riboflavin synthase domain-like protein [Gonapodya prolifera JEL478]|uniref:NADPH-dependent diflavin oxidoreductase 1 n=1 Tax=Gonapodya prolifera (strain JEL478) TaxID=1344416 RepID=A0A139ARJ2_GONPJ|nr:riboflavin synthase domain-like protein [Gonapodya prolifera JEL478]|eukprot:KXS19357.1 riboflavin synthase domain-like protein [Gonapodya prolifera JEL478]